MLSLHERVLLPERKGSLGSLLSPQDKAGAAPLFSTNVGPKARARSYVDPEADKPLKEVAERLTQSHRERLVEVLTIKPPVRRGRLTMARAKAAVARVFDSESESMFTRDE